MYGVYSSWAIKRIFENSSRNRSTGKQVFDSMVQQLQLPEQPAVSIMDTTAVGDFLVEEGDSGLVHPY